MEFFPASPRDTPLIFPLLVYLHCPSIWIWITFHILAHLVHNTIVVWMEFCVKFEFELKIFRWWTAWIMDEKSSLRKVTSEWSTKMAEQEMWQDRIQRVFTKPCSFRQPLGLDHITNNQYRSRRRVTIYRDHSRSTMTSIVSVQGNTDTDKGNSNTVQ